VAIESTPTRPLTDRRDTPRRWRFSLRSLMMVMTGIAVVLGLGAALPTFVSQILIGATWLVATGWLVPGIVFAQGDQRAFCIGAAVVVSSTWTGVGARFLEGLRQLVLFVPALIVSDRSAGFMTADLWLKHILLLAAAVANGWLCIYARRYFERSNASEL